MNYKYTNTRFTFDFENTDIFSFLVIMVINTTNGFPTSTFPEANFSGFH